MDPRYGRVVLPSHFSHGLVSQRQGASLDVFKFSPSSVMWFLPHTIHPAAHAATPLLHTLPSQRRVWGYGYSSVVGSDPLGTVGSSESPSPCPHLALPASIRRLTPALEGPGGGRLFTKLLLASVQDVPQSCEVLVHIRNGFLHLHGTHVVVPSLAVLYTCRHNMPPGPRDAGHVLQRSQGYLMGDFVHLMVHNRACPIQSLLSGLHCGECLREYMSCIARCLHLPAAVQLQSYAGPAPGPLISHRGLCILATRT